MTHRLTGALLLFTVVSVAKADFALDFSSTDPLWTPDRYDSAGFANVVFDGDSRLQLTISPQDSAANRPAAYSSSFYNTQGRQHPADITGDWSIMAQTYVAPEALSGPNLRRTDLWASCGLTGSEVGADYFIIGYYRMDANDPFNPNSPNLTSGWRVFDDNIGWINLALSFTGGWHNVGISYDQTANVATYLIDGQAVYNETPGGSNPLHLRNVNLEAYNFGQPTSYDVYWDDLAAGNLAASPIPEPSAWAATGIGLVALCLINSRLSSK